MTDLAYRIAFILALFVFGVVLGIGLASVVPWLGLPILHWAGR